MERKGQLNEQSQLQKKVREKEREYQKAEEELNMARSTGELGECGIE